MESTAVFADENKSTEVKYNATEEFKWEVPAEIEMKSADEVENMEGTIFGVGGVKVTKSILAQGVDISISSDQVDDNDFYLINDVSNKINFKVLIPAQGSIGNAVENNNVVLTQQVGEANAETQLCYLIEEENVANIHYAGEYSATMTFTAKSNVPQ